MELLTSAFGIVSDKDKDWINRLARGENNSSLAVLVLYFSFNGITAGYIKKINNGSSSQKMSPHPLSFYKECQYIFNYKNRNKILVPAEAFEFHFDKKNTYGSVLRSSIQEAIEILANTPSNNLDFQSQTLIVGVIPAWLTWEENWKIYANTMHEAARHFKNTKTVVSTYPRIAALTGVNNKTSENSKLIMIVEELWTSLFFCENGNVSKCSFRAIEIPSNSDINNTAISVRVNDGPANTSVWRNIKFSSLVDALKNICSELNKNGWPTANEATIVCKKEYFGDLKKVLEESGLAKKNDKIAVTYDQSPACSLTENIYNVIAGMENLKCQGTSKEYKKEKSENGKRKKTIFDLD